MKCIHRQQLIGQIIIHECTPKAKVCSCDIHEKCSLDDRPLPCDIKRCSECADIDNGEVEICDES